MNTPSDLEGWKAIQVNLIPASDNKITIDGLNNGGVNISFVGNMLAAGNVTTITVGDVDDVAQGTVKSWVFPTVVDGCSTINIAGFHWKYIWFTVGASGNTHMGSVTAFVQDRKPPANSATIAALVA